MISHKILTFYTVNCKQTAEFSKAHCEKPRNYMPPKTFHEINSLISEFYRNSQNCCFHEIFVKKCERENISGFSTLWYWTIAVQFWKRLLHRKCTQIQCTQCWKRDVLFHPIREINPSSNFWYWKMSKEMCLIFCLSIWNDLFPNFYS